MRYFPFEIVGWTDTDGNECTAVPPCEDLSVTVTTDLFPSETSYQLVNTTTGAILLDVPAYTYSGQANTTIVESAGCQSVDDCYELTINDSYGDGICCFWGNGSYSVALGSTVVNSPTGGAFGSSETVEIGNCGAYQANSNQKMAPAGIKDKAESNTLAKLSAYPNPLEDLAHFEFTIPETGSVTLDVVNLKGDIVGTLHSGIAEGGHNYKVTFDASHLSSGIYFVQLVTPAEFLKEKLVIIK